MQSVCFRGAGGFGVVFRQRDGQLVAQAGDNADQCEQAGADREQAEVFRALQARKQRRGQDGEPMRPGRAIDQDAEAAGEGVLGQQAAVVGFGLGDLSEYSHGWARMDADEEPGASGDLCGRGPRSGLGV